MTGTPLLTRRLLLVEWACGSKEESESDDIILRIPVLGLGAFGEQVLTSLASTRQTTALEWLPASADPWSGHTRELVFVVADWREAASARRAAQIAGTCREHGCLTVAIVHSPAVIQSTRGAHRRRSPWYARGRTVS